MGVAYQSAPLLHHRGKLLSEIASTCDLMTHIWKLWAQKLSNYFLWTKPTPPGSILMIQRWLEIQLPLIKSLIIHDFSTTKPTSPDPKTSKATRVLSVQTIQQEALTMIASKVNWSRRSTRQLAVSPHQCFQSQASCATGSSMFRAKVTKPSWCYWVCIITITSSIAKLLAKQTNIPQIFCTMNLKGTGQDWALYSTIL